MIYFQYQEFNINFFSKIGWTVSLPTNYPLTVIKILFPELSPAYLYSAYIHVDDFKSFVDFIRYSAATRFRHFGSSHITDYF